MLSFDHPQMCTKCQGYKTMPYSWNSTAASRMCNCSVNPRYDLAWKCPRCKKINAPWKGSCDCTPTTFGAPTCTTQSYTAGINPFNHFFKKKDEV
jgi:hypothetical protein